jgi:hypothetical protein
MDNRLDFFNTLNKYLETLTDDDALMFIHHNKKDGDALMSLVGDWELLSILFSVNGYTNLPDDESHSYYEVKKMILNTAYNICLADEEAKNRFINNLK